MNTESIQLLINKHKDDTELLGFIGECLSSFGKYHACIYKLEMWLKLYDYHNMSKEDYQNVLTELDKSRSTSHNAVISNIGILNRLCTQHNIPLIYGGTVSEERPHRTEIANVVLAYVEDTVKQRR